MIEKYVYEKYVYESAMQYAKGWINQRLGGLDDIPSELQNTIANLCYKFAVQLIDHEANPNGFPIDTFKTGNFADALLAYGVDASFLIQVIKDLPDLINEYRKVLKTSDQKEIDFVTFVFLCMWKYRIENVPDKSYLRLKIETLLRRKKVDEISDLYGLMFLK